MTFLFYFSLVVFLFVCLLLCLVILIQESKSMGLGASFGGDAGDSLFGTSTADVLKKTTGWLAGVFMLFCVLLSLWSASLAKPKAPVAPTFEEVAP